MTTLPANAESQNGLGVSATRRERFDAYGRLAWLQDERGYITYHEYTADGLLSRTIQDVDDEQLTLPSAGLRPMVAVCTW